MARQTRKPSAAAGPDMFEQQREDRISREAPLAARMRPTTLDEFVGQEHIVGGGHVLRRSIEADQVPSIVLWGPPGTGKTTLARIIAHMTQSHFEPVSAVESGVADLRRVLGDARQRRGLSGQRTILFIDEIHRFNKAQQDVVLPHVEDGSVTLIGATTENPSFEIVAPLLSRSRVYTLNALAEDEIRELVDRALTDPEHGLGHLNARLDDNAESALISMADGDARAALTALEVAVSATPPEQDGSRVVDLSTIEDAMQHRAVRYDKGGEEHYNIISAFIKSMRASDPDAALYWMARMLEGGEDPLFIVRRMVIFAAEDVGLADPLALSLAIACQQAVHFVGMPEGYLPMAEACLYLATAPKSNSAYKAYLAAQQDVRNTGALPVPLHLRNAPHPLMSRMGYANGYKYPHDFPSHVVDQQMRPDSVQGHRYFEPTEQGLEAEIKARIANYEKHRRATADAENSTDSQEA